MYLLFYRNYNTKKGICKGIAVLRRLSHPQVSVQGAVLDGFGDARDVFLYLGGCALTLSLGVSEISAGAAMREQIEKTGFVYAVNIHLDKNYSTKLRGCKGKNSAMSSQKFCPQLFPNFSFDKPGTVVYS